jgi:hypothetical protein
LIGVREDLRSGHIHPAGHRTAHKPLRNATDAASPPISALSYATALSRANNGFASRAIGSNQDATNEWNRELNQATYGL